MKSSPNIVVSREYNPAPDVCARALELLLKKPVSKEAAPASRPDDDAKEFERRRLCQTKM
jgi:hypothetical protein